METARHEGGMRTGGGHLSHSVCGERAEPGYSGGAGGCVDVGGDMTRHGSRAQPAPRQTVAIADAVPHEPYGYSFALLPSPGRSRGAVIQHTTRPEGGSAASFAR